jgi:CBS domain-containing protein
MTDMGNLYVADKLQRVTPAYPDDSLLRAAELLAQGGAGMLPIVAEGTPIGVLTEQRLRDAIASGANWSDPVGDWMEDAFTTLRIETPIEAAVPALSRSSLPVVGVDAWGRYVGVVNMAHLLARPVAPVSVGTIGGMATPLGVYLTNGAVRAGAGSLGLALTGALLFVLYLTASWIVIGGARWAQTNLGIPLLSYYDSPYAYTWLASDLMGLLLRASEFILFLLLMRMLPIAGTHAAEHMVVHAIERGEPLVLEVVRRMPRVHPRCGTNLVAAVVLFLGLANFFQGMAPEMSEMRDMALLFALLITVMFWRPFGELLQWLATTKPPTDAQLLSAIRVGEQLLQRARPYSGVVPPFGMRLLNTGLPQILLGAWGTLALLSLIEQLLGITLIVG